MAGWEKQQARVAAIKAGKVDPNDEFDPDEYLKMSRLIDTDPKSVNATTDIWDKVGLAEKGGLSTAQAKALDRRQKENITRLNSGLASTDPIDKNADIFLSNIERTVRNLFTKEEKTKEDRRQAEIQFVYDRRDFAVWRTKRGKDATQDEADKFLFELTRPAREEIKLGLWDSVFTVGIPANRAVLAKIRKQALIDSGDFGKFTAAEKAVAEKLLQAGATQEEVLSDIAKKKFSAGGVQFPVDAITGAAIPSGEAQ